MLRLKEMNSILFPILLFRFSDKNPSENRFSISFSVFMDISIIFNPDSFFSSSQGWVTHISIRVGGILLSLEFVSSKSATNPLIVVSIVQVS